MTIFNCNFVSVEARNVPAFLSGYTHSITICTNGLLFSSYATATYTITLNPNPETVRTGTDQCTAVSSNRHAIEKTA